MIGKYPTYVEMANAIRAAVSALSGGLPAGGSTGEVLTKASAVDYDATWQAAPAAPNGLPTGGTTGQALIKNSATNYDASFTTIGTLPVGGTTLQLLAKSSATDYATSWVNFSPYAATILQTVKDTTSRTSTSATTLTATGLTFSVTSGQMYRLQASGTFQSAATTTGLALGFSTSVATTYCGWTVKIELAGQGTNMFFESASASFANPLISTGVVTINTDYQWFLEARFQPSATGTLTIGFRSEVNGSQVTWRPGAIATLTPIA